MPKDIKTKSRQNNKIKTIDRATIYTARMKDKIMKAKKKTESEISNTKSDEVQYANDEIVDTSKDFLLTGSYEIMNGIKKVYKKVKSKTENTNDDSSTKEKLIRQKQREELIKGQLGKEKQNQDIWNNLSNDLSNNIDLLNDERSKIKNSKYILNTNKNKITQINKKIQETKKIEKMAKATKETTKKIGKVIINSVKKVISSLKNLIALIASGGILSVVVIIIIIIIAMVFGSMFGVFFTNETSNIENNMTIETAISSLNDEINKKVDEIKKDVDYDSIEYQNKDVAWKNILIVYSVLTTNRENTYDITQMNEENYEKLKEIFWQTVNVNYDTETYTVNVTKTDKDGNKTTKTETRTRLLVNLECMSLEEMMTRYNFNDNEKRQAEELQKEEYDEMWEQIL